MINNNYNFLIKFNSLGVLKEYILGSKGMLIAVTGFLFK